MKKNVHLGYCHVLMSRVSVYPWLDSMYQLSRVGHIQSRDLGPPLVTSSPHISTTQTSPGTMSVAWPSGLRRWFKAPVSSEAWVRIPPLPRIFSIFLTYPLNSLYSTTLHQYTHTELSYLGHFLPQIWGRFLRTVYLCADCTPQWHRQETGSLLVSGRRGWVSGTSFG